MADRMKLQSDEFDAANKFAAALSALPPVVDDDYPHARSRYEGAAYTLLRAMKENGRFEAVMSLSELSTPGELSLEKIEEVNNERKLAWHKEGEWTDERWFTATAGEFGELGLAALKFLYMGNQVKKEFRAKEGSPGILKGETLESLDAEIEDEWADVMLYLILFASARGIKMSEALRRVFNRKSKQLGLPHRL